MLWIGLCALFLTPLVINGKPRHSRSDTAAKLAPQGLSVDRKRENSIDLSWTELNPGSVQGYYVSYHSFFGNLTAKLVEPQTTIRLSDLEPGTSYRVWVSGYQLKNGTEIIGPASFPLDFETLTALEPPRVVNLTCIPPDELLIEWSSDLVPDLYFVLRYRFGNTTSYDQTLVNASLDYRYHQQFSLREQILEGYYEVGLRSVVDDGVTSGRRESEWSENRVIYCPSGASAAESTDAADPDGAPSSLLIPILLITATTIFLTALLLGLFFWRKFYSGSYYYLDNPSLGLCSQGSGGWYGDDSMRAATEIQRFPSHVAELHRDGDIGFSKEYEAITGVEEDYSAIHSAHPDNKTKNRYLNIVAYDHTRVRLENSCSQKCSDYFNGNYIDGFERPKAYIGTQGPLRSTFAAFWQLVWENRVSVIVMITNLVERGRPKCDQYWPSESDGVETYGLVEVRLVKEETMATYILRTFTIRNLKSKKRLSSEEKLVWQFQYVVWPDHGVPSHPLPVLSFVRKSSAANPPEGGPIIVHCSAGVGRTGTYIVLDAMLRQIAKRGDLNIFGFLQHIRRQRNFLVQTEEQYIFCHDALLEAIQSGETNISLSRLPQYLKSLRDRTYTRENGEVISMFQRQYELVTGTDPKNCIFIAADKKCNITKHRIGALKTTDHSRVLLIPKPGVEGSDYINASFLPGFARLREFILTSHPVEATFSHFWQMLCDHNVSTVVLLTLVDDEFPIFWPEPEADLELDGLCIKHLAATDRVGIASRSFAIIQEDDDELHVNLIQSSSWPRHSSNPTDLFELIQMVQDTVELGSTGPIVVVDRYGGTEGATFCALTTICNQLDSEAHLDVYLYAKLYHDQRPGLWPTFADYAFLYESIDGLTKGRRNSEPLLLNGPSPPSPLTQLTKAPLMPPPTICTNEKETAIISRDSPEPAAILVSEQEPECADISELIPELEDSEPEEEDVNLETADYISYDEEADESNTELIPQEEEKPLPQSKVEQDGPEESVD